MSQTIQINLAKLSQGILEINVPENVTFCDQAKAYMQEVIKERNERPKAPAKPQIDSPVADAFDGKKLISSEDVFKALKKLGCSYTRGRFTAELERAKIVKRDHASKVCLPGSAWKESMGTLRVLKDIDDKNKIGMKAVHRYNAEHPAIRSILNNIYMTSRCKKNSK